MKAIYVFYICVSILCTVGCMDNNTTAEQDEYHPAIDIATQTGQQGSISLDSFQRRNTGFYKGRVQPAPVPDNKLSVRKDADSMTFSGICYAVHEDDAHRRSYHTYRFYYKTTGTYSNVYLQHNIATEIKGDAEMLHQVSTREAAWHLKLNSSNTNI